MSAGQKWALRNTQEINAFTEYAQTQADMKKPITVSVEVQGRTLSQNSMFYSMYRDIADKKEDQTLLDIRKECKLHYGVKIRKSGDPEFCKWYDKNVKPWSYEAKLILMEHLDITSTFTKPQAIEYITTVIIEYGKQGVFVHSPV